MTHYYYYYIILLYYYCSLLVSFIQYNRVIGRALFTVTKIQIIPILSILEAI